MRNLAIIPARGGSKRIPRKNIRDFLGKPIIAYSIETAFKSGLFDEVMVSTEDEEIAEVAKEFGARVPFIRSNKNADDYATLADVVDEVIDRYETDGKYFKYGCCILPTAPLLQVKYLIKGFKLLNSDTVDSVRPITRFSYPIQRALKLNENGQVQMFYPENKLTRSQDLEPAYHDTGQFYLFKVKKRMRGEQKHGFEINSFNVHDIDTIEDWKIAENKYKLLQIE